MKMRSGGAASGVSKLSEHLPALHTITGFHSDASAFQVLVKCVSSISQIESHVISAGIFQRNRIAGFFNRWTLINVIGCVYDGSICYSQDFRTVPKPILKFGIISTRVL